MSLSERLHTVGRPLVDEQLAHPTVAGIAGGDLDERTFASWLEQDYLYLLDYVRVFARLAWQAPPAHLESLIDLAHSTLHEELELHRSLSAEFGADLDGASKGPVCRAYTSWLIAAAADYGEGLAAVYPCMWGYSTLGAELAERAAAAGPRYRRWIETYSDPGFAELTRHVAGMLEESGVDPERAEELFLQGMRFEVDFWTVPE
ncbi:TenA family protein [Streptomonospora litoralis]|uniref:Thiaminase-2 n=1 Tax=Streptomonospora litoralis TaxID=2498135 RepID=A0A4V0ZJ15_9ACTN|nr:transcriptional regulator [Streptomonospora litoralis]QBI51902.1 Thiaminase-2 [Streptomonospora litoralis]